MGVSSSSQQVCSLFYLNQKHVLLFRVHINENYLQFHVQQKDLRKLRIRENVEFVAGLDTSPKLVHISRMLKLIYVVSATDHRMKCTPYN